MKIDSVCKLTPIQERDLSIDERLDAMKWTDIEPQAAQ